MAIDLLGGITLELLASGLLFLFMLGLTTWVWWKRRPPPPPPHEEEKPQAAKALPVNAPPMTANTVHAPVHRAPDLVGLLVSEHSIATKTGDVLGNLRKSLMQALTGMPQRSDLRLKLLQLLYHEGSAEEFEIHKRLYAQHTDIRQDAAWTGIEKMSAELSLAPKPATKAPTPSSSGSKPR